MDHMCIYAYNTYVNTHSKSVMGVPNFSLHNERKSELRMGSNLVKIGCLKEEEKTVFLKAKKKKVSCAAALSRMLLIMMQDKKPQLK